MDLSYDGSPFFGWQIQPGVPTVQGSLESVLETLLHCHVGVTGAGRTDTGVHALRYVAHFDFDGPVPAALSDGSSLDCAQLRYKLNAMLPREIAVSGICPADPDFHARFDAVRRSYSYYLHRAKNPFLEKQSYYYAYPDVDFELMNRCAALLAGTHDFSCFEKSGGDNKTSVCTVVKAAWTQYEPQMQAAPGTCWRFDICADRFLRNMVRAVVGTLLEVGRGKRSPESFATLVLPVNEIPGQAGHDGKQVRRSEAGESVPAHALFLTNVEY
ncbi:MAG: tRNA pseudouridine(38-40) synthase TruA [Bacteroidales bacterium]|nr:tRNA pseudouridine(38-40) synthase TruA [Bacteroidales bacterium]